jgi:hypothetical protein
MKINHEVSQADHVAGILSGTATTTSVAATRPLNYRIPVHLLAVVDAMADQAKKSRNAMLNLLLQVAIDDVREKLDTDVIESLSIGEAKAMQVLLGESLESIEE